MHARHARPRRLRVAAIAGAILGGAVLAFACGPGAIGDLTNGIGRKDAGDGDACPSRAAAPPRPAPSTEGPSIDGLVFAARDIRADTASYETDLAPPKSLDLDHTCPSVEPPSCRRPANASPITPLPDGRDNVTGPLLATLTQLLPVFEPGYLKRRIAYGLYTLLFEVKDWNGTDDDPKVLVTFRISIGMHDPTDGGSGPVLPKFDGKDRWDIDPGSIFQGDLHIGESCADIICLGNLDANAYVSGGTLVASFDAIPLVLNTGSRDLVLPFKGATLTGRISKPDGLWKLDGEIAGRLPAAELLSAAGAGITDPTTFKSLCVSPTPYALLKENLCAAVDLAKSPEADGTGAPCEALSEAIAFTAGQARLGYIRAVPQSPSDCPGFTDRCGP